MGKRLRHLFTKKGMLKDMMVLAGGTALAQLISFGASPLLSRLYTEENYGDYGIFTSVVSYFVVIACLRLEQAILIPKENKEAKSIAQWGIKINFFVSVSALFLTAVGVVSFALSPYFLLIGPTVFFMGLINIFNFYSSRADAYEYNSRGKILTSFFLVCSAVLLGYLNFGAIGLILGMSIGQLVGSIYLLKHIRPLIYNQTNTLKWRDIKTKYSAFLFVNTPHALFDLTESAGVVLILGLFFDKADVGAYFFAIRIMKTPLGVIGSSIFQVFYKEASALFSHGKSFFGLYKKLLYRLSSFSLPFFLLLYFLGKEIFVFVFSEEWMTSGLYAELFAPWLWLNFIASTISCVPIILNKQNIAFGLAIINTVIRLSVILISGLFFTFEIFILTFAIVQTITMIINNSWFYYLASKYGKGISTD